MPKVSDEELGRNLSQKAALKYAFSGAHGMMIYRCPRCDLGLLAEEVAEHDETCEQEEPVTQCFTIEITVHKDDEVADGDVQAKYHVSGPDDVYWLDNTSDVERVIQQSLKWRGTSP